MKMSKILMVLTVAVLPLAGSVGYCGEDIEGLKADNIVSTLGDIGEIIRNLVTGRRIPRPEGPDPAWPMPESWDVTGYEQVKFLFEDGILPDEKDFTGWFTGRMFLENRKNVANSALLVGTVADSVVGGGPLFSVKSLKIRLFDRDEKDNFFDAMTPEQVLNYEKRLDELTRISPVATEFKKNGVVSSWPLRLGGLDSVVQGKVVCEARKSGDYLVVKITETRFNVEADHTKTHYAYFFKDVTPTGK